MKELKPEARMEQIRRLMRAEFIEISNNQITEGLVGHGTDFKIYSDYDGKPLENFEQENDVILFTF